MRSNLSKIFLATVLPGAALFWTLWTVACDPARIADQLPYSKLDQGSVSGPIDFALDLAPPADLTTRDLATPDLLSPSDGPNATDGPVDGGGGG